MFFHSQFITHDKLPDKDWYISSNKLWYYHTPKKNFSKPEEKILLKTVDPFLKKIFLLFQNLHIKTYPSCQGHFYKKEKIKKIWNHLLNDESKIKTGIIFSNVENGKKYFHINKNYILPWENYKSFFKEIKNSAKNGYFAFASNNLIDFENLKRLNNSKINVKLKNENIIEIWVFGSSYKEQKMLWNDIYKFLKKETIG